jgi:NDP-mannose synthase
LKFQTLVDYHRSNKAICTIASHVRNVKVNLGVIQTNLNNEVVGYIEKPTYDLYVSMGIYVFEPRVLSYINYNKYLDFPDLVLKLIDAGERVMSYSYDGYWMDLGRLDDYEHAVKDFETLKPQILGDEYSEVSISSEVTSSSD